LGRVVGRPKATDHVLEIRVTARLKWQGFACYSGGTALDLP